jgi:hypothetical protein
VFLPLLPRPIPRAVETNHSQFESRLPLRVSKMGLQLVCSSFKVKEGGMLLQATSLFSIPNFIEDLPFALFYLVLKPYSLKKRPLYQVEGFQCCLLFSVIFKPFSVSCSLLVLFLWLIFCFLSFWWSCFSWWQLLFWFFLVDGSPFQSISGLCQLVVTVVLFWLLPRFSSRFLWVLVSGSVG